ncbi:MAG: prepilin-type N-terminal cleavage/methylation domain-containing protein [Prosthecobacter sp.]
MLHPPPCPCPSLPSVARGRRGFSIIEMLVVVVLLGVLSGMGIGGYAAIHRGLVEKVSNQRNAQEIVSMGVYATMGGAQFVVSGDKEATVQNLIDGTLGQTGAWKGKVFRLTMDPETVEDALSYVKFESNLLLYEPAGGQDQP